MRKRTRHSSFIAPAPRMTQTSSWGLSRTDNTHPEVMLPREEMQEVAGTLATACYKGPHSQPPATRFNPPAHFGEPPASVPPQPPPTPTNFHTIIRPSPHQPTRNKHTPTNTPTEEPHQPALEAITLSLILSYNLHLHPPRPQLQVAPT